MNERHILGLSGGRDSAALAVYMRQHFPELPLEYFFTDTGRSCQKSTRSLIGWRGSLAGRLCV